MQYKAIPITKWCLYKWGKTLFSNCTVRPKFQWITFDTYAKVLGGNDLERYIKVLWEKNYITNFPEYVKISRPEHCTAASLWWEHDWERVWKHLWRPSSSPVHLASFIIMGPRPLPKYAPRSALTPEEGGIVWASAKTCYGLKNSILNNMRWRKLTKKITAFFPAVYDP